MTDIQQYIQEAREEIGEGLPYDGFWWTAGNTRKIQVGDFFLIQRTIKDRGYFASGKVVAAPLEHQLRLANKNYSDLSEAYINDFNGNSFRVAIEVYSIVDFDYPLEIKILKEQRNFIGVNFVFMSCGCEFRTEYADLLYSEWEKHSMILARKGLGIRLVDVLCEQGQECRNKKQYKDAIAHFEKALLLDPKYTKAKNGIKICKSILERQSKATNNANAVPSTDDIGNGNAAVPANEIDDDNASNEATEEPVFVSYGSPENNRKVEVAAINFVTKYYEEDGWSVRSVELEKVGYDLICEKCGERQDVEVKGRSGNLLQFIITPNELGKAEQNQNFVLCLVTSALRNPTLMCWTGRELLQQFEFYPVGYKAQLKAIDNA